jgi:hypothetical protein
MMIHLASAGVSLEGIRQDRRPAVYILKEEPARGATGATREDGWDVMAKEI